VFEEETNSGFLHTLPDFIVIGFLGNMYFCLNCTGTKRITGSILKIKCDINIVTIERLRIRNQVPQTLDRAISRCIVSPKYCDFVLQEHYFSLGFELCYIQHSTQGDLYPNEISCYTVSLFRISQTKCAYQLFYHEAAEIIRPVGIPFLKFYAK
jgi:hypothetical protein